MPWLAHTVADAEDCIEAGPVFSACRACITHKTNTDRRKSVRAIRCGCNRTCSHAIDVMCRHVVSGCESQKTFCNQVSHKHDTKPGRWVCTAMVAQLAQSRRGCHIDRHTHMHLLPHTACQTRHLPRWCTQTRRQCRAVCCPQGTSSLADTPYRGPWVLHRLCTHII
jgi:hypothetical protein